MELPGRTGVGFPSVSFGERNICQVDVLEEMNRTELAVVEIVLLRGDSDDELEQEVDPGSVERCRRQRLDYNAYARAGAERHLIRFRALTSAGTSSPNRPN